MGRDMGLLGNRIGTQLPSTGPRHVGYPVLSRFFRRSRLKKSPAPSTPSESSPKVPPPPLATGGAPGGASTPIPSVTVFEEARSAALVHQLQSATGLGLLFPAATS